MPLSDSKLRNIKAPYAGKPELADRDGLTVRILRNKIITFNYRFRWLCKQQRIKICRYLDIKLVEARNKQGEYRQVLLEGLNPRYYSVSHRESRFLGDFCNNFI